RPDPRSALAHFADSSRTSREVREVPQGDIEFYRCSEMLSSPTWSLKDRDGNREVSVLPSSCRRAVGACFGSGAATITRISPDPSSQRALHHDFGGGLEDHLIAENMAMSPRSVRPAGR